MAAGPARSVPSGSSGNRAAAGACQGERTLRRSLLAAIALVVLASACAEEEPDPTVLRAGQVDIKLPEGWTVEGATAVRPARDAPVEATEAAAPVPGAPVTTVATDDTVPLAQDDPQTAFFKAVSVFQQCMSDNNTEFIGVPDASNPSSPTNDPDYLSVLGTCASKSNILQALQDVQAAEEAMTPADIEEANEGYLVWRDCMIARGWGIPEPKPDERGRLFSLGNPQSAPQIDAPPGEDLLSSDDFAECLEEARG